MKTRLLIVSGLFLTAFATVSPPAHALTSKECSAKYQAAKAAGTLNGMKWNDFRKAECGGAETPAAAPPPAAEKPLAKPAPAAAAEKPAAKTAPAAAGEKPVSPGRQAMLNRMHACSAEWKTMKAEGKRPAGMKWPQFWHECDQREKAKGM
jgi:hypothetical protein